MVWENKKNGFRFRVDANHPPSSYVGIYYIGDFNLGFAEGNKAYPYVKERGVIEINRQKGNLVWGNVYFLRRGASKIVSATFSGSVNGQGLINLYGSIKSVKNALLKKNIFLFTLRNTGNDEYEVSYGNLGPGSSFNSPAHKLPLGENIIDLLTKQD